MGIREERALGLNHADLSLQLPDTLGPSWCFETNMVLSHREQQKVAACLEWRRGSDSCTDCSRLTLT